MRVTRTASFLLVGGLVIGGTTLGAAEMTLTGTVGDAMCGVKHMIKDEAACTKGCVTKGSEYALIVKDKAYTLKASAAQKGELEKLAGKMAMITGDVTGDIVMVKSVKMGTTKK
ncbi:MAG: hypothetical protein ABJA98_14330 [Acidobacteriota bacterium]